MSRIVLRLSLLIPLLLVLTMLLEAYGRILPPTPDALLDICPLPCVLGVTPNVTYGSEVEGILAFTLPPNSTVTTHNTLGIYSISFETIIGERYASGVVNIRVTDNLVESINLRTQFLLSVLIEKWGAPDCAIVNNYNGSAATGVFHWQRGTYFTQALFVFPPPVADWTTADVQALTITARPPECTTGMKTWQGFAPVWRYQ